MNDIRQRSKQRFASVKVAKLEDKDAQKTRDASNEVINLNLLLMLKLYSYGDERFMRVRWERLKASSERERENEGNEDLLISDMIIGEL